MATSKLTLYVPFPPLLIDLCNDLQVCGIRLIEKKHQCIKNLSHVLEAAGTSIDKVVKVNVFLDNMDNFADMNSVYTQYWGDVKPCRT